MQKLNFTKSIKNSVFFKKFCKGFVTFYSTVRTEAMKAFWINFEINGIYASWMNISVMQSVFLVFVISDCRLDA